jgi:hypothetical protein
MTRAGLKKLTLAGLAAVVVGFGSCFYGYALAAFLMPDCPSFRGPNLSFRCNQPMAYLYIGFGLLGSGACSLFAALALCLRRRLSRT